MAPAREILREVLRIVALPGLVILMTLAGPSLAADDPADTLKLPLRVFSDRDGLPQNSVEAVTFDATGRLVVGTRDGAALYDGRSMTPIAMPDRHRSNWVRAVLAARDGSLWFGTEGGGALRLKGGAFTRLDRADGLPSDLVRSLVEHDGTIWIGTSAGLVGFAEGRVEREGRVPATPIRLLVATKGALVVGTELAGVYVLAPNRVTVIDTKAGLPSNEVGAVYAAADGALLIGTSRGLATWRDGRLTVDGEPRRLSAQSIWSLAETVRADGERTLWAGTGGDGLLRRRDGQWTLFGVRNGLPSGFVYSLVALDTAQGTESLWMGTLSGLARLSHNGWSSLDAAAGLPHPSAVSLLTTKDGSAVWIGTAGGGVARLSGGRIRVFSRESGLPDASVFSLLETTRGELLAGTQTGLARFRADRWEPVIAPGLPAKAPTALLEETLADGSTVLWIGTYGAGLSRLANGVVTKWDVTSGLPDNRVEALLLTRAADGAPTLWVGTDAGLVGFLDGKPGAALLGLPNPLVRSLLVTTSTNGRRMLWVGTSGGLALRELDTESAQWRFLTEETTPALPNDTVYQLRQDRRGRVYVFTNRGVARLSGEGAGLRTEVFTLEDGLPSNECNFGASLVDGRGRVWVGTVAGAAMLDPDFELPGGVPKPLVVKPASLGTVPFSRHPITFDVSLLSLLRESQTRYQTQLVGLDESPSPWTAERHKEYSSLPPGRYVFRAWGRDGFGVVSGPVSVSFEMRPARWRSPAAYAAYTLAALLLGLLLHVARLGTLRRRNELLERRIAERSAELAEKADRLRVSEEAAQEANRAKSEFLASMSHELRTPLNAIIGYAELVKEELQDEGDPSHVADLEKIHAAASHQLGLINSILDLAKVEAGRMELHIETFPVAALVDDVLAIVDPLVANHANTLTVAMPEDAGTMRTDRTKARQALLNLLSNAAKFTEKGSITLTVTGERGRLVFLVTDTGAGMTTEEMSRLFEPFSQASPAVFERYGGTGLGLAITKRFAEMLGGGVTVTSEVGKGSAFTLSLSRELPAT